VQQWARSTVTYCTFLLATVCAYGGILLAAVAALVACSDCVRSIPLFIVQGLMWVDGVGFLLLFCLSVVRAVRFLFLVVGVLRCLVVGLLLGVVLSASLRLLPVVATLPSGGCSGWTAGCSVCVIAKETSLYLSRKTVDRVHCCTPCQ
jgi:hypothetical protein